MGGTASWPWIVEGVFIFSQYCRFHFCFVFFSSLDPFCSEFFVFQLSVYANKNISHLWCFFFLELCDIIIVYFQMSPVLYLSLQFVLFCLILKLQSWFYSQMTQLLLHCTKLWQIQEHPQHFSWSCPLYTCDNNICTPGRRFSFNLAKVISILFHHTMAAYMSPGTITRFYSYRIIMGVSFQILPTNVQHVHKVFSLFFSQISTCFLY